MGANQDNNLNSVAAVSRSDVWTGQHRKPLQTLSNDRANFTADEVVNAADFTLLKGNYGHAGAPTIGPVIP